MTLWVPIRGQRGRTRRGAVNIHVRCIRNDILPNMDGGKDGVLRFGFIEVPADDTLH